MSTEISGIGSAAQATGPVSPFGSQRPEGAEPPRGSPSAHAASVAGPNGHAYGYYAKQQAQFAVALSIQDQRLDAAASLREVDTTLGKIDSTLGEMQTALEGIVKQYPPYGPDASERIKLINQITGLKKQLEALAFPPELSKSADPTEALTGQGIADKPPQEIPDEALAALLDKVESTRKEVAAIREKMWTDVVGTISPETEQPAVDLAGEARPALAAFGRSISILSNVLAKLD